MDYSLKVFCRAVKQKKRKSFEVSWPNIEEMRASTALLEQNRIQSRLFQGVFGITDGGRMPCADFKDLNLQNAYFQGFTQNVKITNFFVRKLLQGNHPRCFQLAVYDRLPLLGTFFTTFPQKARLPSWDAFRHQYRS